MLEIIMFIFSDFWIWLGTFLLIGVIFEGLGNVVRSGNRTISEKRLKRLLEKNQEEK